MRSPAHDGAHRLVVPRDVHQLRRHTRIRRSPYAAQVSNRIDGFLPHRERLAIDREVPTVAVGKRPERPHAWIGAIVDRWMIRGHRHSNDDDRQSKRHYGPSTTGRPSYHRHQTHLSAVVGRYRQGMASRSRAGNTGGISSDTLASGFDGG